MFKRIGLAFVSLLAVAGVSLAAGLWANFPIIGGASYCGSTINGVCQLTVAAGPAITGNETIPADTNASGGSSPQTALLSMADLGALPTTVSAASLTTNAISASNLSGGLILSAASTIAQAAISLPPAPVNGQRYRISANRTITALGVDASGSSNTIAANSAPSVLTASTTAPEGYEFLFNKSDTTWYRVR